MYRIVRQNKKFHIQERVLWFFWVTGNHSFDNLELAETIVNGIIEHERKGKKEVVRIYGD